MHCHRHHHSVVLCQRSDAPSRAPAPSLFLGNDVVHDAGTTASVSFRRSSSPIAGLRGYEDGH